MADEEYFEPENYTNWEEPLSDQDDPASSYFQVQFIIYLVIVLVGILGNTLVFKVLRGQARRSLSVVNSFLVNLSVADFGVLVIFAPFYLAYEFLDFEWPFGLVLCKVVFSVTQLCMFVSLGTLVAVAVERYRITFRTPMKKSHVKFALLGIWLLSVLLSIPQLIVYKVVELEEHEEGEEDAENEARHIYVCDAIWPDPLYEKILQPVDLVLLYFVPLAFIAAIYGKIIYSLRQVNLRNNFAERVILMKHGRRAVKTLTTVVIVFALLNLPIHVFHMYRVFYPESWIELVLDYPWLFSLCVALVLLMHTTNPLIYGICHGDFRRGVLELFTRGCTASNILPKRTRRKDTPQTFLQDNQSFSKFHDLQEQNEL